MSQPVRYYIDHNFHGAITDGVRRLGIDCLTAEEDGRRRMADDLLLQRATDLQRVMVSQDLDMWVIASGWLQAGRHFGGLAYGRQWGVTIGNAISDLQLIAGAMMADEMCNQIIYLPL
jgi:hypothetical protein